MPVCHYCSKNNLFTDVDVYKVREDIARKSFRSKAHRICDKCIDKYEKKHGITLTILKEYHSKTNPITISQRRFLKRKEWEVRKELK